MAGRCLGESRRVVFFRLPPPQPKKQIILSKSSSSPDIVPPLPLCYYFLVYIYKPSFHLFWGSTERVTTPLHSDMRPWKAFTLSHFHASFLHFWLWEEERGGGGGGESWDQRKVRGEIKVEPVGANDAVNWIASWRELIGGVLRKSNFDWLGNTPMIV